MRWPYPRKPALGRDLPPEYAEGEKVFDRRVKAKFPIGTSEGDLIAELRSQGFSVDFRGRCVVQSAKIERGLIFRTGWSVRWRAKAGRIEEIWGVYGVAAP